jgi:RNA polymerase sigma factor (TIGR02999 family)
MVDVTQLLDAAAAGDPKAAADLLPLVYEELRRLAAARMAREKPGQTGQATALVHDAYIRLVGPDASREWNGRGHFFAAAAEAMRRILVENARRKQAEKRGGGRQRQVLDAEALVAPAPDMDLVALDAALNRLAELDPLKTRLVELRYFAGLTSDETAEVLGISSSAADRLWVYARAWLRRELGHGAQS